MISAAHLRQLESGGFEIHALEDHLFSVAKLARLFATQLNACKDPPADLGTWAELAGLWHDLGKYQPAFQQYIASASGMEAHIEAPGRVKHAIAGAMLDRRVLQPGRKASRQGPGDRLQSAKTVTQRPVAQVQTAAINIFTGSSGEPLIPLNYVHSCMT